MASNELSARSIRLSFIEKDLEQMFNENNQLVDKKTKSIR